MVTKQQLDAMGKILPVQEMEVCGVPTPCISSEHIPNVIKYMPNPATDSIKGNMLQGINYITDEVSGTIWVTVEALIEFVRGRKTLPNKPLIIAYLESVLPATQEG